MLRLLFVFMILTTPVMAENKLVVPVNAKVQNGSSIATSESTEQERRNTQTQIINGVKAY